MSEVFVAINGDDVGSKIGGAIASDDRQSLSEMTSKMREVHRQIDEWVESIGGEVVTSSGDEGIYIMPEEALETLEGLMSEYKSATGHTLTVGVGSSMSEASKALIFGKIRGKNTIVEYSPEIESAISEEESEALDMQDQDPMAPRDEEQDFQDKVSEDHMEGEQTFDINEDDEENIEEADLDTEEVIEDAARPQDEEDGGISEDNDEEEFEEDIGEEEEEGLEDPEESLSGMIEEDMSDGEGIPMDEDSVEQQEDESEELPEEIESEVLPEEDPGTLEDDMDIDSEDEMEMDDDTLRERIVNSLQIFKEYKEMIDAAEQQAPDFYQAMISMLESMIDMARKLGYSPEQDIAEQEMAMEDSSEDMQPEEEMAEVEAPVKKPMGRS